MRAIALVLLAASCGAPAIPPAVTAPTRTPDPPPRPTRGTEPAAPSERAAEVPRVHVVLTRAVAAGKARVQVKGTWSLFTCDGVPLAGGRSLDGDLVLGAAVPTLGATSIPAAGAELWPGLDGDLRVDGRAYPGTLRIERGGPDGRFRPLVATDVETYVAGVVNSEIPAAFPTEAQRAQAVIARTYAFASRPHVRPGDLLVMSDVGGIDQEFNGLAPVAQHRRVAADAAQATRGLVLLDGDAPLPAYYHSTCGGTTCPAPVVFGRRGAVPGLAGDVACGHCIASKYWRWDATIPGAKAVAAAGLTGPLEAFSVAETTAGGRAVAFDVRAGGRAQRLRAAEFRLDVGPSLLRSTLLESAAVQAGDLVVRGRGWGHGVGLCQMGAKALAERGDTAAAILSRYYPGTRLQKLW